MRNPGAAFCVLLLALVTLGPDSASATNPDFAYTPAERDSVLADYDNVFPIFGRKAIEKGFELPLPGGLNLNYMYMDQDVEISKLGLSLNDAPTQEVDFIELSDAASVVHTVNLRADLWVFPFLNVYGFGGSAIAETEVSVLNPVQFTSKVDQTGSFGGIGLTTAMGVKRNWLSFDINWSWSKLDKLVDPVQGRVLGIRYGRRINLSGEKSLSLWVGTMNQKFKSETSGSIALSEVLPPDLGDQLGDYQNSPWYQDLPGGKQALVDEIVDRIVNGGAADTKINYALDKAPATKWNMVAGANYEFNPAWHLRAEFGFIERYSLLINLNYRFGL